MYHRDHAELLRSVSRSFYLSVHFLPRPMREPVALGYLLARLTDTLADAPGLPPEDRLEELEAARLAILGKVDRFEVSSSCVDLLDSPDERALLRSAPRLIDWLRSLDSANRSHLEEVLLTILHGQREDVRLFGGDEPACLATGGDLHRYAYRVAGVVGEFWTKVGFTSLGEGFSEPSNAGALLVNGRRLGQGLQLVNILRDLHEDIPAGRCYLPREELVAAGWDGQGTPPIRAIEPVFERWLSECEEHLAPAETYVGMIRNRRVRFCTRLPMLLARATVRKLREAGVERVLRERVRISRAEVRRAMGRALFS